MKKKTKIIMNIILILIVIMSIFFNVYSYADTAAPDPGGFSGDSKTDVKGITNIGNQIITIVSTIGSIVSVTVLVIIGVKYMFGSIEERVEYKKSLLPYLIGSMVVFGASVFSSVIFNVINNF